MEPWKGRDLGGQSRRERRQDIEQARQGLEGQVLERAAKDPQFRDQLKADPRGTMSREFGVQVPQDITVDVVEETPWKVYLVLSAPSAQPGQALTDQDLEAVAGGWSVGTDCGSCDSCNPNRCG